MAVPPQLAAALPDGPADAISAMLMPAPGAPWSDQLLQDILDDLFKGPDVHSDWYFIGRDADVAAILGHPGHRGLGDDVTVISAKFLHRPVRRKGQWTSTLTARVFARPNGDRDYGLNNWPYREDFGPKPFTVAGLREAIEWVQQKVAMLKRRNGWCVTCDKYDQRIPDVVPETMYSRKRIRVHGTEYCAPCFVRRSLDATC